MILHDDASVGQADRFSVAIVQLGPCAMLPPHYHPRAANWVVAMSGNTTTWMQEENGAHTITTHLTPMKATIFPAGALHMMGNEGEFCMSTYTKATMCIGAEDHANKLL